jgi:hypothetical protein
MKRAQDYITPMVELALAVKSDHERYLSSKLGRSFKLFKPFVKKGTKTLMVKFIGRKAKNEELAPQVGFEITYDVGRDLYNIKAFYSPPYIFDEETMQIDFKEPVWGKQLKGMFWDDLEDPAKIYYDLLKRIPSRMGSKIKTASKEYVIWGIPEGKSSEDLLLTVFKGKKITNRGTARKLAKLLEDKYGATKTRIQEIDLEGEFDWMKMISRKTPTKVSHQLLAGELVKIAKSIVGIVDLPVPVTREKEEELDQKLADAEEELGRKLDRQKSYYWQPGRSVCVNVALTGGLNIWEFSPFGVLPHPRLIYRDGVLKVTPTWTTYRGKVKDFPSYKWPFVVDKIIKAVKMSEPIEKATERYLKAAEQALKIKIPTDVRKDIVKYCLSMAKRRLTTSKMRKMKPREFVISEPALASRTSRSIKAQDLLEGATNRQARSLVNKLLDKVAKGIFRDEYWRGVKQVWNVLDKAGIDWHITRSEYHKNREGVPESKEWKFEVEFVNDRGRPTTLYGVVLASGTGSVEDPLEKYDVIAYVS